MKSTDALDHAGKKPKFSKKDNQAFAKAKQEEETSKALKDPKVVKETSKQYKKRIAAERERLGLPPLEPEKPPAPLPDFIDTKRFDTVEVKVDLSKNEKDAAGLELAFKRNQRADIESEMKARANEYKTKLKEIDVQMDILTTKATLGWEYRKFRCTLHLDFKAKQRIYKDADTIEIRKRQPLEADDYQMRLPV